MVINLDYTGLNCHRRFQIDIDISLAWYDRTNVN